ncbi:MAG: sigma 54-interacting transcriptional regulator [Bacillota bacterium]|nr:sigma 54-interacting transcriptional regulator [Bacillota bacterium]
MVDQHEGTLQNLAQMFKAMDEESVAIMATNLKILMIVMDHDLKLQYGNDVFFNLVGWKQEEVIGQDYVQNFIPAEMTFLVGTTLREIIDKQTNNYSGSNQVLTRDRGVRFVNWNSVHLRAEDGKTQGMLCIGIDITEYNSMRNILGRADREKNIILENVREPVVYHDDEGRISWANQAFLDLTGTSSKMLIGTYCHHLFTESDQARLESSTYNSIASGQVQEGQVKFLDGTEWISKAFIITGDELHSGKVMRVMFPAKKEDEKLLSVPSQTSLSRRVITRIIYETNETIHAEGVGVFSDAMAQVMEQARIVQADRTVPVLIEGETGTGKEVVARFIHNDYKSNNIPFVDINCAAITPTIFESELFGYEGGSFTGGRPGGQKGKLDIAKGGTLFLDEIGEIPVSIQAKLLRVLQEKEYYPVGGLSKKSADVRLICATNVDLEQSMLEGTFRRDLFYRLEAFRIHIPALRERPEDIIPLARMFLVSMAKTKNKQFSSISDAAARILLAHTWPGNVRQLRNVMERLVLTFDDKELKPEHLHFLKKSEGNAAANTNHELLQSITEAEDLVLPEQQLNLQEFTDQIIRKSLKIHGGNKTQTAIYLGMSRRSLTYRLKQMGMTNND